MKRYICVECNKPIKQNSKSAFIHRKCWLQLREKDERYLDFLFVKDKEQKKKVVSVRTEEEERENNEDYVNEIIDMVNANKPVNYEEDQTVTYSVDIAGNEILI